MGHFYTAEGLPMYEVPYADPRKGLRATTLGDAKKLGLAKSVTTVLDVPDKPALLTWKTEQVLKAAYEASNHEAFETWKKKVLYEASKIGRDSANRGAEIHNVLEQYYLGNDLRLGDLEYISPVVAFMAEQFPGVKWIPEQSFTSKTYGFGGRVDMYSPEGIVLDFKTKATSDIKKMVAYAGHHMQTAAYTVGLSENDLFETRGCCGGLPHKHVKRFNLFISTEQPGLLNLTESLDFEKDWEMFEALNTYWDLSNNYKFGG